MNIEEKLELAVEHHQQGRVLEAESLYREVLAADPASGEALRLLGLLLGNNGRATEAIALFERAISIKPNNTNAFMNLGGLYRKLNQVNKAVQCYRECLRINPNQPAIHNHLGLVYQDCNEWEQAATAYRQAIALNPKAFDAYNNLGMVYKEQEKSEQAIQCYQKAIALSPLTPETHNNLGNVYQAQEKLDLAQSCYEQAIALRPDYPEAHSNLGVIYQEKEDYQRAIACYHRAIEYAPNHLGAFNNLAIAHRKNKNIAQALIACHKAIQIDPNSAEAHYNLATLYQAEEQWDAAITAYEQAIALKTDYIQAQNNLGLLFLSLGRMQEGWQLSECRFENDTYKKDKPATPMWDGTDLNGKSIVIWNEQGLGDALQFVRYAHAVKAKGGDVTLRIHRFLKPLFQTCLTDQFKVIGQNDGDLRDYDEQISIMSLPYVLKTTLETIPAPIPYILPPAQLRRHCILPPTDNIKIGIVWASHIKNQGMYEKKSCTAQYFTRFLEIPDVNLYSLQVGIDAPQIEAYVDSTRVFDCSDWLKDFVDTATVVHQLDLVICIDTAVAHLAGAMGKLVWLLLPDDADWRWLLEREDSPWYPTMRLFRQQKAGNWADLFTTVTTALSALMQDAAAVQALKQARPKLDLDHFVDAPPADTIKHGVADEQTIAETLILPTDNQSDLLTEAVTAHQAGNLAIARELYLKILQTDSTCVEAWRLLGVIATTRKNYDKAIERLQQAIALDPQQVGAYINLGGVYKDQGLWQQAIAAYRQAIAINPSADNAYSALGNVQKELHRWEKARESYEIALRLNPNNALTQCNFGLFLLLRGRLKRGFALYESRFKGDIFKLFHPTTPMWDGKTDLNGASIMLWNEQGFGDTLQFVRYAYVLKERGAKVILCVHSSLVKLLRHCLLETFEVIAEDIPAIAAQQHHVSMMSLPHLCNTDLAAIPYPGAYLREPAPSENLKLTPSETFKVGIVWASKRGNLGLYDKKTCPLAAFMDLLALPSVELYSLQVGEDAEQITPYLGDRRIHDLSPLIHDFHDTASLIAQLDLVICVDTAIAHLAGAMGKPTWLLLSYTPDWRWLLEREDSPWYVSMRLFRQTKHGDWQTLWAQVNQAFRKLLTPDQQQSLSISTSQPFSFHKDLPELLISSNQEQTITNLPEKSSTQTINTLLQKALKLHQQGKLSLAKQQYTEVLKLNPNETEALRLASMIAHQEGNFEKAIQLLERSIQVNEKTTSAYQYLGDVYRSQGRFKKAIMAYQKHLEFYPDAIIVYNNIGLIYQDHQQWQQAIAIYQQAIAIDPNFMPIHNNLGMIYQELNQLDKAIEHYEKAMAIAPETPEIHNNLGNVYQYKKDWEKAFSLYQAAIERNPNYPEAYNNLGAVCFKQERYEEGLEYCRKSIKLRPNYADPYNNMGMLYRELGDIDQAIAFHEQAIQLNPDSAENHGNIALVLLMKGRFKRGLQKSEWRFDTRDYRVSKPKTPMWDGGDLNGKTIAIWNEQGIGDALHFIRYVPMIEAKGGKPVIFASSPLVPLFRECLGSKVTVEDRKDVSIYDYDCQVSIMSLSYILGVTYESILNTTPYIFPPKLVREHCLLPPTNRYKIGIVWASNRGTKIYAKKTCPLAFFMELLQFENIQLYSLQVGEDAPDIQQYLGDERVIDLSPKLQNFADTATVIDQLDLVISIDTAVAHLAAAMGKPTWILLPFVADWRWFMERADSPWYPTARLFRQKKHHDWQGLFSEVKAGLNQVIAGADPLLPITTVRTVQLTINQLLERGIECYQTDKLRQAEQYFQQILEQDNEQAEALRLLSLIRRKQGQLEAAIQLIQRSIAIQPDQAIAQFNLASIYAQLGRHDQAIQLCEQELNRNQDSSIIHNLLGSIYQKQENWTKAIYHYKQTVQLNPNAYDTYNNLGMAYHATGTLDQAIAAYQKSIQIKSNIPETHNNLGNVYKELEDYETTLNCYQTALFLKPDYPEAHNNLGAAYFQTEVYELALTHLNKALELRPNYYEALKNIAIVYNKQDNYEAAIANYQKALTLQPNSHIAYNELGKVYEKKEDWETAIQHYQQAIAIKPDYIEARCNLGDGYQELGQLRQQRYFFEAAIECYQKVLDSETKPEKIPYHNLAVAYQEIGDFDTALVNLEKSIEVDPDSALAHGNIGLIKLLQGDLIEGGKECESRFDKKQYSKNKPLTPMWDGTTSLLNKSIVLWNEQGIGDAIHFVRYAKILRDKGANVIICVHELLVKLFQNCLNENFTVIDARECDIYQYDYHASVLSLPLILQTTVETIPNSIPYIFPPPTIPEKCILPKSANYKIGIVWASHANTKIYHKKTAKAKYFMDLLHLENIELYSLQVGVDVAQIDPWRSHPRVHDLSPNLDQFDDTATIIKQLDLIISVDTAVAHLAGAMGKPVWVILPYIPDYRWFMKREDSPWYPTMRLFRQPDIGDWSSIFRQIDMRLQQVFEGLNPIFPL